MTIMNDLILNFARFQLIHSLVSKMILYTLMSYWICFCLIESSGNVATYT